jgi:hypothetical protein
VLWQAFGRCFQSVLSIKRGQLAEGIDSLKSALEELREIQFGVYYGVFLGDYAEALGLAGRTAEALSVIEQALARFSHTAIPRSPASLARGEPERILMRSTTSS